MRFLAGKGREKVRKGQRKVQKMVRKKQGNRNRNRKK
jgi:hypothetical protein